MFRPLRHRSTIALAVAATIAPLAMTLVATVAAPVAAHAVASSATCASTVVVVVRGSSETAGTHKSPVGATYASGGFGMSITAAHDVQSGTTGTVRIVAVDYPAVIVGWNDGYVTSEAKGVTNLRYEVNWLAKNCPSSKIALIGYSQGAQVVGDVLDKTTPTQLTSAAKTAIKAAVIYGDPTYRVGEPFDHGGGLNNGFLIPRGSGNLSTFASRLYSYCLPGDAFCQGMYPFGQAIHTSYKSATYQSKFAAFILGKI
jgi:hypothetical protein